MSNALVWLDKLFMTWSCLKSCKTYSSYHVLMFKNTTKVGRVKCKAPSLYSMIQCCSKWIRKIRLTRVYLSIFLFQDWLWLEFFTSHFLKTCLHLTLTSYLFWSINKAAHRHICKPGRNVLQWQKATSRGGHCVT